MNQAPSRIPLVVRFLALALLIAVSAPADAPGAGVEGIVMIGPINAGPMAGATFDVKQGEHVVASFRTDEQGKFRLALAAGCYTTVVRDKTASAGNYGPFEFEVAADRMTVVEWHCDNSSGVRLPPTAR